MSSEIVRVNNTQVTIKRPDGSTFEYTGPAEELSIILAQLDKQPSIQWVKLANSLRQYQPLIWTGLFALLSVWLLLWAVRPVAEYQPQSQEVRHAAMG